MTLLIDRLVTRGKFPRNLKVDPALVERVAREQFTAECARQLRRPWPVQTQVVRIRRLRVQVRISGGQLTPDSLANAWTAAFVGELFTAIAHPNSAEIVRFESRALYLASAIRELLTGTASQRWVFEEFAHSFNLGTAAASLALFEGEPAEIVPALLILENWSLLDRLLAAWDGVSLERLFLAIGDANGAAEDRLSLEDLITVANLLLDRRSLLSGMDASRAANLGDRKLALRLFLLLAGEGDRRDARIPSPLRIFRALGVLDTLLDLHSAVAVAGQKLPLAAQTLVSARATSIQTGQTAFQGLLEILGSVASSEARQDLLNAFWYWFETEPVTSQTPFAELLGQLTAAFRSDAHREQIRRLWKMIEEGGSERRSAFTKLIGELTSVVSSDNRRSQITQFWDIIAAGNNENRSAFAALFEELASATDSGNRQGHGTSFKWISTECAGLFLVIDTLDRLGWADRLGRLSFGAANGPRLLTYVFAGIASAMLGRFDGAPAFLDPGLALFSGWVEAPDLGGLRRFFATEPAQTRRDLLFELLGNEVTEEASIDWAACFDFLANRLIREFAGRIRGFGRSSRSFIVKNFLALPGRIRVEETRLLVVFTSSPLNAVVHLSRLDDPIEEVSWLAGRRIEFEPYGP